jgi:hypothetical protein
MEVFDLLGCYVSLTLKMGPICSGETSVTSFQLMLLNTPEDINYTAAEVWNLANSSFITNINRLLLFREIITVYSENHSKSIKLFAKWRAFSVYLRSRKGSVCEWSRDVCCAFRAVYESNWTGLEFCTQSFIIPIFVRPRLTCGWLFLLKWLKLQIIMIFSINDECALAGMSAYIWSE